jgi:MarR family 2-MHQ and catechol resistance regulon transcriptional repressor
MSDEPEPDLEALIDPDILEVAKKYSGSFPEVDELAVALNYLVTRTHAAFLAALTRDAEKMDLSPARLAVVRILYYAEGRRLPMKDLVTGLSVSGGNVTRLVSGLVAQGLITRETPEHNRRSTFAELTTKGVETFERAMPMILGSSKERLSILSTKEKEELLSLLAKLRHALEGPRKNERARD